MIRSPRSKHRAQRVYRPSLWRSRIPTERLFDSRPSPWRAWHSTHSMTIPDTSTPVPTTLVPIKKIIRPKGESSRSKQSGRGFDILEVTQLSSETWGEIKAFAKERCEQQLDYNQPFSKQSPAAVESIYDEMYTRFPFIKTNYENGWVVVEAVKAHYRNRASSSIKPKAKGIKSR